MFENGTADQFLDSLCPVGIEGLDHVLNGGVPRNRFYLVQGDPGVGKTTLAIQFLLAGIAAGERGLYVTLSETKDEIEQVARSHGWDLGELAVVDLSSMESQLNIREPSTLFHSSEVELTETMKTIFAEIHRVNPQRVVLDSLSEVRLLAGDSLRYRRQLLTMKTDFARMDLTALVLDNHYKEGEDTEGKSLAHGVILMQQLAPEYGDERRRIRILKMRGAPYRSGHHDYVIRRGGLVVFPRLNTAEESPITPSGKLLSGIAELDQLTGGGLDRCTSNLFAGPAGSGKSVVATVFATAAADRGERVEVFTFDESRTLFINRAKHLRQDITAHLMSGMIGVRKINPAEITPGEFADGVRTAVRNGASLIILDSVNGYWAAMPEERHLALHLHELCSFCSALGATIIMLAEQKGLVGQMQMPIDVTYLADAVMLFRHFESAGEIKQALAMVKKRTGMHERAIRELTVDELGVRVGESLRDFHGILTGVPTFHGDHKDIIKPRHA